MKNSMENPITIDFETDYAPEDFARLSNETLIEILRADSKWYEKNTPLIRTSSVLLEAADRLEKLNKRISESGFYITPRA